jgi:hypothetical protein
MVLDRPSASALSRIEVAKASTKELNAAVQKIGAQPFIG